MKFEIYPDRTGHYRWRLLAPTGETLSASPEAFATPDAARAAVLTLQATIATAPVEDAQ